jgi:NAD(P)H-hydrate epimerase
MKIFSAEQIRQWDEYTIRNEPISSIELMERAALTCFNHIIGIFPSSSFVVFAGPGNNGGDGVAIARLLKNAGRPVELFHPGREGISENNRHNLERWTQNGGQVSDMSLFDPREVDNSHVIIDALFGTGQHKTLEGQYKEIITKMNNCRSTRISIDLPSGMYADRSSLGNPIVRSDITLSFQLMKLCFLVPENGEFTGEIHLLDIGLSKGFYEENEARYNYTTAQDIKRLWIPRPAFSHKGSFGTAIIFAGKKGMMGAAILAAGGCLRSGVGKLVCRIPGAGLDIMQISIPEAICSVDDDTDRLANMPKLAPYQAIGVGPGIGDHQVTRTLLDRLLKEATIPMVLDADALNIIAAEKWQDRLKAGMVISPHPGEFKRLFGEFSTDFTRLEACMELSTRQQICVILKGHYSFLSTPSGKAYFNSTGNPGMAKAGSGDVLTGMITSFLAQKYSVDKACLLSAYLHGKAGDLAESSMGQPSFLASDIIKFIGPAFSELV